MTKITEVYQLASEVLEKEFVVPEFVKDKVWNEIEIDASGLILYERRPHFQNPNIITKLEIFKLKYSLEKKIWTIYWMPSDSKWHKLEDVKSLRYTISYIKNNGEYFWG